LASNFAYVASTVIQATTETGAGSVATKSTSSPLKYFAVVDT
jgi:hypothetical protein